MPSIKISQFPGSVVRNNVHRLIVILTLSFILVGCNDSETTTQIRSLDKENQFAVIVTAAADFSSGAHSLINVHPPRLAQNNLAPTLSDLSGVCQGRFFYRIERFTQDNVTKFDIEQPDQAIFQYSTQDLADAVSSNPATMVFVSAAKAYLLRYGSTKVWIVNPAANTESEFKIGELDLSAYDEGDGIPEMQDAVIAGDKLFVVLQRLSSFEPTETAYVAVFDVATDTEVDTGMGAPDGLRGIPLEVKNPLSIQYLAENERVYIQAVGRYAFGSQPEVYSGGIESIDTQSFTTQMVVDDGDDLMPAAFGQIQDMVLVSPILGYFIGTAGFQNNTLYRFNPSSGAVFSDANGPIAIGGLFNQNLTDVAVDKNNKLWVGNGDLSAPGIVIIDTTDDSIEEALVATELNPVKTVFCETP